MRQIDMMLRRIDKRVHNTFARDASLHGIKIPIKGIESSKEVPDNSMDEEIALKSLKMAQERVRSRYGK